MKYTEKDLVSFGAYLLSKERKKSIRATRVDFEPVPPAERLAMVHDADLKNWKTNKNI